MKRFFIFLILVIFLVACGHRESPTGGKKDTESPQIISISPVEFSDISKLEKIEVVFSKPIKRNSLKTGLHIYPPILEKELNWDGAILNIEWQENLQDSANYFFTFNTDIKGEHDNLLDRNYTFVFRSGKTLESTIAGNFSFEKVEDKEKEVTLAVSTADSVNIFTKKITDSTFRLEHLNRIPHILQAYIDKNRNGSYNPNSEPYDYRFVPQQKLASVNLELTYQDTTKPKVNRMLVLAADKMQMQLSEPVKKYDELQIYTADSLKTSLQIIAASLEDDAIFVLSSQMDTLKYTAEISELVDLKGNVKQRQTIEFEGIAKPDTLAPKVLSFWPADGTSIKQLIPDIVYKFDEVIFEKDIKAELLQIETGQQLEVKISGCPAREIHFQPKDPLQNYTSYSFKLQVADKDGNVRKIEPITFISIVR